MKRTSTVTMGRPCKEERREGGEGHLVIVTLANRRRTRGSPIHRLYTLQAVTDAHSVEAHGVGANSAQPHGLG